MKVLFLLKYGTKAASTRYRFVQFEDELKREKIEYKFSFLLDNAYLEKRLKNKKVAPLPLLQGYLKRFFLLFTLFKYDLVVIHCEAMPYLPAFFEGFLKLFHIPYIYDLDDAIFHQYDSHSSWIFRKCLGRKIAKIMEGAQLVQAGNHYIASYAKKNGANADFFPTVIDMNRYLEKNWDSKIFSNENPFIVGWIGSPTTAEFIYEIADALRDFFAKVPGKLVLIGSGKMDLPQIPHEIVDWSEETEINQIHRFDVGIMPLRLYSDWDKGKCAFKLIQYLGCGIPAIASHVGANEDVVLENKTGYLVSTKEEWLTALLKIYSNREQSQQMGKIGRSHISDHYSKQSLAKKWIASIKNAAR